MVGDGADVWVCINADGAFCRICDKAEVRARFYTVGSLSVIYMVAHV